MAAQARHSPEIRPLSPPTRLVAGCFHTGYVGVVRAAGIVDGRDPEVVPGSAAQPCYRIVGDTRTHRGDLREGASCILRPLNREAGLVVGVVRPVETDPAPGGRTRHQIT